MSFRIITISRQYGCGARAIGKRLAGLLRIDYYDKELIRLIARQSGYSADYIEEQSDYASASALDYIPMAHASVIPVPMTALSNAPQIHRYVNDLILQIAEEKPCVIIGRSADYILRDREDVLNVYLYAHEEDRIREILNRGDAETEEQARKLIEHYDRGRRRNYRQMTNGEWGDPNNYHLCLNAGTLGGSCCTEIIAHIYSLPCEQIDEPVQ